MRDNSLSPPTNAELMALDEQREANRLELEKLELTKKANRTALIAATAATIAAIASIANIIITVLSMKK